MSDADHEHDDGPEASAKKDLTPQQVLEMLAAGKTVENARVSRLRLKGEFDKPVRFRHCHITRLEFENVVFKEDVQFFSCTMERPTCNRNAVFEKMFDVSGSTLNKSMLRDITVKGNFQSRTTRYRNKLSMIACTFEGKAFFWEATVEGWAEWKDCTFKGPADLRSMQFTEGVTLANNTFEGEFLFRGTQVAKKFDAMTSTFNGVLDLSKAKLYDFVYLEGIRQGPEQRFALSNMIAERVLIRPEQVEGRLLSEINGEYDKAMIEYGLLKQSYQNLHRFDQEDWAFYRFKVAQRRGIPRSWKRPFSKVAEFFNWLLLDKGCGYGTDPLRSVIAALIIVLGFGLVYSLGVSELEITDDELPFTYAGATKYDLLNRVTIGLKASMAVFTSGMGDLAFKVHGWLNVPMLAEAVLGVVLFGLFIVAFSRKVIR